MIELPTFFGKFAQGPLKDLLHVESPELGEKLAFVVITWIICALMIGAAVLVGRNLQRIPGRLQNVLELIVEVGNNFVCDIVGPEEGPKYTPFILTLFLFIFLGSVIEIIPGFTASTSNLNTTVALALVAFVYVNYQAVRQVGFRAFVKGFFPPPLLLAPLLGPLELISHIIRPLTLSVRLFGNIFGEDVVIAVLTGFGIIAFILPIQPIMVIFSIFTDIVQAAVFCMLTTIYIGLLTSHGHDDQGEHAEQHPHDPGRPEMEMIAAA